MEQAQDFLAESRALADLIAPLDDRALQQATLFKGWRIDDILQHLHFWNLAAGLSLEDGGAFSKLFDQLKDALATGSLRQFENDYLNGLAGRNLAKAWIESAAEIAAMYAAADPKARVTWAGPSMSARSAITARLMETWAHGQAVYDALGVERQDSDRIRNIVVLGVNTFGWTFQCRGLPVPSAIPYLVLQAPAGAVWTFGDENIADRIEGSASAFCQVVTQTRNIADTDLKTTGQVADAWMQHAQCFAGPPETPPAPGVRRRAEC